jgi:hypothetical protein
MSEGTQEFRARGRRPTAALGLVRAPAVPGQRIERREVVLWSVAWELETDGHKLMALPDSATFQYVVAVPRDSGPGSFPWPMQMSENVEPIGDSLFDDRLVGYAPLLQISEGEEIPDPTGLRTTMTQSRLTLRASTRKNASVFARSFCVDRELTLLLQPGDLLHLSHSCMWGTGVSLLRKGQLVFAVGAVLGVPLGKDILVKMPDDVVDQTERFHSVPFEQRRKKPLLIPIEFHVGNEMRSILGGKIELGRYEIWLQGGSDYSYPSGDTFAAISTKGLCESIPAIASAMLLKEIKGHEHTAWPT